jgi:hypothetical protein
VLRFELRILEELLGLAAEPEPDWQPAEPPPPAPRQAPPPVRASEPEPEPEPTLEREPAHIDDEPELVGEFSDPGAEEGAGAELHVDEPWDGYQKMSAADIRDRVAIADVAEITVIQLYESSHRRRRTVFEAVERRSKELANLPA